MLRRDDSRFPLLVVDWLHTISNEELQEHLVWMGEQLRRAAREDTRLVMCVSSRLEQILTSVQRAMLAEAYENGAYGPNERMEAIYFAASSRAEHGIATALRWQARSPSNPTFRTFLCRTRNEALRKAKEKLRFPRQLRSAS